LIVEAEQDPYKANPLEYAMKARAYLREVAGL
jgi:inosose dehydratase